MEIMDFVKAILCNLILAVTGCFAEQWNYHGRLGPEYWNDIWPECCAWNSQSPIDIVPSQTEHVNVTALSINGFNQPSTMNFTNNGHTVELTLTGNVYIKGGLLDGATYQTDTVTFHWGETDERGSEHSLHGGKYQGEIQINHYDRDIFDSLQDAAEYRNGVAILAIFIEVGEEQNPTFEKLVEVIDKIKFEGDSYTFPKVVNLEGFLPSKRGRNEYYFYEGSMTSPHCNEVVQWIIYKEPIQVSRKQLASFRQIQGSTIGMSIKNKTLFDNFRPIQPLNGRTVFLATSHNGARRTLLPSIWISFTVTVFWH